MTVIALAVFSVIFLVACSSDDGDEKGVSNNPLVGTWVCHTPDVTEEYSFGTSGGTYSNSAGTMGDFTYTITSGSGTAGGIYIKITKYREGSVWRDEYSWTFRIEGNKLYMNGRTYTKK